MREKDCAGFLMLRAPVVLEYSGDHEKKEQGRVAQ
jgi:hypothetical protein